jgi:hypothetical protein
MNIKSIPRLVWLVPVVLLVVAASRLPYGYYTFMRIVTCGIAGVIAFAGSRSSSSLVRSAGTRRRSVQPHFAGSS